MTAAPSAHRLVADVVVTCDAEGTVFEPGVVDVVDDRITWVGARPDAPPVGPEVTVRDLGGVVMPGLINAHAHTPMTLFRSSRSNSRAGTNHWLPRNSSPARRVSRMSP